MRRPRAVLALAPFLNLSASLSTPAAIRTVLARYSTWSCSDQIDLGDAFSIVDYGDVEDSDGEDGSQRITRAVAHLVQV
jgi:arginase family enzyme